MCSLTHRNLKHSVTHFILFPLKNHRGCSGFFAFGHIQTSKWRLGGGNVQKVQLLTTWTDFISSFTLILWLNWSKRGWWFVSGQGDHVNLEVEPFLDFENILRTVLSFPSFSLVFGHFVFWKLVPCWEVVLFSPWWLLNYRAPSPLFPSFTDLQMNSHFLNTSAEELKNK